MSMRLSLFLLLQIIILPARAHTLAPALLEIQPAADPLTYQVLWRVDQRARIRPPEWPAPCVPGETRYARQAQALDHHFVVRCSNPLEGQRVRFENLSEARTTVLLRFNDGQGRVARQLITADHPEAVIPTSHRGLHMGLQYFQLGLQHILGGLDHLLLVLGLWLLATHFRQLLLLITAFTLGHSLTLALGALDLLRIPSHWVEMAIAATLLALALELQGRHTLRRGYLLICTSFGLIHGLGFAGELRSIGLPDTELLGALLSFNLGIEAGQLLFILLLITGARLLRTVPLPARTLSSYLIGSLACFWLIDRGLRLWTL